MKLRLSLFGAVAMILLGCSSDDDNSSDQQLEINEQNLIGKWYIKGGTINGGEFQSYVHKCSTQKDFQEFLSSHYLNFTEYGSDCNVSDSEVSGWHLEENILAITAFDPAVNDYEFTVLSITNQELTLKMVANEPEGVVTEISKYTRN